MRAQNPDCTRILGLSQENSSFMTNQLAIFDLDNTLLIGDSDHAWGEFLIEQGLVDAVSHKQKNDQFYSDYCEGKLDIYAYQAFALSAIKGKRPEELTELHQQFMANKIEAMIGPKALQLIDEHKARGDQLLIITATNDFVTQPIGERLGIKTVLGCNAEIVDGVYTGQIAGTPCFQEGKVTRLKEWLQDKPLTIENSIFYSDSHNDLPLMEAVGRATAVDPDEKLESYAKQKGWPIISLR